MTTQPILPNLAELVKPFRFPAMPHEFKVTTLRECPTPEALQQCDTPDKAAEYWRMHIEAHPYFNSECECLAVLLLNTRRRVKWHQIVSIGTQDTILVHPREVFRLAIVTAASAVIVMHNLCGGSRYVQLATVLHASCIGKGALCNLLMLVMGVILVDPFAG